MEELPSLNGTRFSDLPPARQRKILNQSIRGIVLNAHADEQARFDLFERINTGSKGASTAEVRRGALGGAFQALVVELADTEILKELAPVSTKSQRERIPEELVARFFAYGATALRITGKPVEVYLRLHQADEPRVRGISSAGRGRRFLTTMAFIRRVFPYGFRKGTTAQTNPRVRFEAIAVGSSLAIAERPELADATPDVTGGLEGEAFQLVTSSDAANVKSKLQRRLDFVRNALLEA